MIKTLASLSPAGSKSKPLVIGCFYLLQLVSFWKIIENQNLNKVKMSLITLFLYFTSMQYFYRGSHRERFSSLQLGGVCPGSDLCNFNVEWTLLVLEVYGLHVVTVLVLPMFTLGYKGGSQGRKDLKTIELKIRRKIKKESAFKLDVPEDPSALYDADDDLLSDQDELNLKSAKVSKFQVHSNIV